MHLATTYRDHSWILNNACYSIEEAVEAHELVEDCAEDLPSFEDGVDKMVDHISGIVSALSKMQRDLMPPSELIKWQKENGI